MPPIIPSGFIPGFSSKIPPGWNLLGISNGISSMILPEATLGILPEVPSGILSEVPFEIHGRNSF